MNAVEELVTTIGTTGRSLDRIELQPDPTRDDWSRLDAELTQLKKVVDEDLLGKLPLAVEQLGGDPATGRLRDEVAYLVAEIGAIFQAAGKRDLAARFFDQALKAQPSEDVANEIRAGQRDPVNYVHLVHGRWHQRGGDFTNGDRVLERAKKAVADAELKKAYEKALGGARPLTGGAPALFRLNGFGVGLYGSRDHRPDGTYVSTHCISALFIPVWPLGAYRVRDAGYNRYEFFAKEPLSSFAKGYRWFALAAVVLAFAFTAVGSYLDSPSHRAAVALEDAQELEESGDAAGAIDAYERVVEDYGFADHGVASEASTSMARLLVAGVEAPLTAARVDEAARVIRRYQELPEAGRGGASASLLAQSVDAWADQIGDASDEARRAQLRLLDLGTEVAQGPDRERLAGRASSAHIALAERSAADWPLEALDHYVRAGSDDAWTRAGALVASLPASLFADAVPQITEVRDASITTPDVRGRIDEVRQLLASWDQNPDRMAAMEQGDAEVLRPMHEAQPEDQELRAALADALRANGDFDAATELLTAIGAPGQMCSRAQVALAACYLGQDRLEEADQLLSRQVEARLPEFAAVQQELDAVSEREGEALIRRAQLGLDYELESRLRGLSDEDAQGVAMEWLRNQLDANPEIQRLRERSMENASVVPTALMLGTIKLRRAHAASGEEREALLEDAERLFLAIRNEAEGVPTFHLNLGQVYHRLGRAEEGEAEFQQLLAAGDPSLSLAVAQAYRELGLEQRARETAEGVYESTNGAPNLGLPGEDPAQLASAAAMLMSHLAMRLEDEELWLSRADQSNEGVQIRLLGVRGQRALQNGDLREAARLFGESARRYEAMGSGDAASVNNAAVAYEEQYLCTGDTALLDRARTGLERALTIAPDNSLLVANLAAVAAYRGDIAILEPYVQVRQLRLAPQTASALVAAMLGGSQADAVRAALAASPLHRRAAELTQQEQVLAPQRTSGWERELAAISRAPTEAAMAQLLARLRQVNGLDTSGFREGMEHEPSDEERERTRVEMDAGVSNAQELVAAARRSHSAPTLSAALYLLSFQLSGRAWERRSVEDAAAASAAAREAVSTWDGFGPRLASSVYQTQALLEAMPGTRLESLHESDRQRYSSTFLALRATREDSGLRSALAASPLLDEVATLRASAPRDQLGISDRALAELAAHDGLRSATAFLSSDARTVSALAISDILTPEHPELALWHEMIE
ncbi:MAG: hypothetical protein AB7S26_39310 [Sandaracinaceae bacterium]